MAQRGRRRSNACMMRFAGYGNFFELIKKLLLRSLAASLIDSVSQNPSSTSCLFLCLHPTLTISILSPPHSSTAISESKTINYIANNTETKISPTGPIRSPHIPSHNPNPHRHPLGPPLQSSRPPPRTAHSNRHRHRPTPRPNTRLRPRNPLRRPRGLHDQQRHNQRIPLHPTQQNHLSPL